MTTARPVFIAGAPRSGTTFLASMLDSHHRIRMGQELWILRMRDEIYDVLQRHSSIGFGAQGSARWAEAVVPGLVDEIIRFELKRTGKARFGDKKPGYAKRIPDLVARFPGAQIVHIVRDARDVAASMLERQKVDERWRGAPWAPTTWREAGRQWVEFVTLAREAGAALPADQYLELRYEELAADPVGTGVRLMAFLGEPLDDGVRRALEGFAPRSRPWREKLDGAALAELAATPGLDALLVELGYEPMPAASGSPSRSVEELSAEVEVLVRRGRLDEARDLLEGAIAGGEDHPLVWSDLAVLAHQAGRVDEAVALLARAVEDERSPPAAVANLLSMADRPESTRVVAAVPRVWDPEVRAALGRWLRARGLDEASAGAVCALIGDMRSQRDGGPGR